MLFEGCRNRHLRLFFTWLFWRVPADIDDFIKFFQVLNRHRHVVISRNNLRAVSKGIDQKRTLLLTS